MYNSCLLIFFSILGNTDRMYYLKFSIRPPGEKKVYVETNNLCTVWHSDPDHHKAPIIIQNVTKH